MSKFVKFEKLKFNPETEDLDITAYYSYKITPELKGKFILKNIFQILIIGFTLILLLGILIGAAYLFIKGITSENPSSSLLLLASLILLFGGSPCIQVILMKTVDNMKDYVDIIAELNPEIKDLLRNNDEQQKEFISYLNTKVEENKKDLKDLADHLTEKIISSNASEEDKEIIAKLIRKGLTDIEQKSKTHYSSDDLD